jgi:hypothetical protein
MVGSRWLNLAVGVPVGAVVFYGAASLMRVRELADVRAAVARKYRGDDGEPPVCRAAKP